MSVEVNWLAVLFATLSTMVVGSIWYTPKVFGKAWIRLAHINQKDLEKRGMMPILVTLVVSFISAYILAHIAYLANAYYDNSFLQDSVTTAFWVWLGFTAARIITHDAFEGRRKKLTLMTISHEFVTFIVMGVIIGVMQP